MRVADADHRVAAGERLEQRADALGTSVGVELAAGLGEAGRCGEIVVGAEDIGLMRSAIGDDATALRVDGGHGLAEETHAGLREAGVSEAEGGGLLEWNGSPPPKAILPCWSG